MRRYLTIVVSVVIAGSAAGQDTVWTRISGQGGSSRAGAVRCLGTDVFVSGLDRDSALGESRIFVVRYDGAGNQMWNRRCGLADSAPGGGGGGGPAGQPTARGAPGRRDPAAVLVKLNTSGDTAWTRFELGSQLGPMAADQASNVFVLARRTLPPPDDSLLLLCFRPTGAESLRSALALADVQQLAGLCLTPAGNIIGAVSAGGANPLALLVKFAGSGAPLWTVPLPPQFGTAALAVAARGADECYALVQGAGGVTLLAVRGDGSVEWDRPVTTGGAAADIAVDPAGNAYVSWGESDCRVDKYGPGGQLLRSFKGGSAELDLPAALTIGQDDNPVAAATAVGGGGLAHVLTVKFLNVPVAVAEPGAPGRWLHATFGAAGRFDCAVRRPGDYCLAVVDPAGRQVASARARARDGCCTFGLPPLPAGAYLALLTGPERAVGKLVCVDAGRSK